MRKALFAGMLVMGGLATGAASAARPCIDKEGEAAAVHTRLLQTELMVSALHCDANDRYNAFIRRFEDRLGRDGDTLRTMFERAHDDDGRAALDRYVTELANEAAARDTLCDETRALFRKVMEVDPDRLDRFAARQTFSDSHGLDRCGAQPASMGS